MPVRYGLACVSLIGLSGTALPALASEVAPPSGTTSGFSSTRGYLTGVEGIGSFLDLLVAFLLGFIIFRLWKALRSRPPQDPTQTDTEPERDFGPDQNSEARRRAAQSWEHLRTRSRDETPPLSPGQERSSPPPFPSPTGADRPDPLPSAPTPTPPPVAGFDTEDFLRGAKIVYSRIRESLASGELPDVKSFVTPDLFDRLAAQAPGISKSTLRVMLVEATILDVQDAPDRLLVRVQYDAHVHSGARTAEATQRREIWRFVKTKTEQAIWLLADMERLT